MKSLKVNSGALPPVVYLPSSKSYANRALILAAVKNSPFKISNCPEAEDFLFLKEALKAIGIKIKDEPNGVTVLNSFPACEDGKSLEVNVGEGGTTARFMACLLVTGKAPYTLILGERLKERPWDEFIRIVTENGAQAHLEGHKLFIQGPLNTHSQMEIDCSRTTQFASGFQLAQAFSAKKIVPTKLKSSLSYWKMTESLIELFKQEASYEIPLDWSSASYPLAFGALKQSISLPGLLADPNQADFKFYGLLESLGCVKINSLGTQVGPIETAKNVEMDVSDCLDLVPALVFFLSHLPGVHRLKGCENLVHKESDRLNELLWLLKAFDKEASFKNDTLILKGNQELIKEAPSLKLPNDHRIIMTAALFMRYHSGGSLTPAIAVNKSYPHFFDLFKS